MIGTVVGHMSSPYETDAAAAAAAKHNQEGRKAAFASSLASEPPLQVFFLLSQQCFLKAPSECRTAELPTDERRRR